MVKFLSTHCPRCNVIEKKLKQKNIKYIEENDIEYMKSKGLSSAPAIELEDGKILNFKEANEWINDYKEQ